jgi:hypothetical protein
VAALYRFRWSVGLIEPRLRGRLRGLTQFRSGQLSTLAQPQLLRRNSSTSPVILIPGRTALWLRLALPASSTTVVIFLTRHVLRDALGTRRSLHVRRRL